VGSKEVVEGTEFELAYAEKVGMVQIGVFAGHTLSWRQVSNLPFVPGKLKTCRHEPCYPGLNHAGKSKHCANFPTPMASFSHAVKYDRKRASAF